MRISLCTMNSKLSLLLEMNHSVGWAVKKSPVHRLSKAKANVMVTYITSGNSNYLATMVMRFAFENRFCNFPLAQGSNVDMH